MNKPLRQTIDLIKNFVSQSDKALGMLLLSGIPRDKDYYFSVATVIIYVERPGTKTDISGQLAKYLAESSLVAFVKQLDNHISVFTKDLFVRIKVIISCLENLPDDLRNLSIFSDDQLQEIIAIDKNGVIQKSISDVKLDVKNAVKITVRELIDRLLDSLYEFRLYATKVDTFRAYTAYSAAFENLAKLTLLGFGKYTSALRAKYLISSKSISFATKQQLLDLQPVLNLDQLFSRYRWLVEMLELVYQRIVEVWKISDQWQEIDLFLRLLDEKFYILYNFRDISKIINYCAEKPVLKQGKIFRSGALGKTEPSVLQRIFSNLNINTVIDLRYKEEIKQAEQAQEPFYAQNVNYLQEALFPIDYDLTISNVGSRSPTKNFYFAMVEYQAEIIARVFKAIAEYLPDGGVLIHCSAGRDRTGLVVALLLESLAIDRKCIIEDYLLSFPDSKEDNIEFLFSIIDERYGGIDGWLKNKAKLDQSVLEKLKSLLLTESGI